jgi:hypothetical protein
MMPGMETHTYRELPGLGVCSVCGRSSENMIHDVDVEMVPKTWDGLLQILDELYPEDVFPTASGPADRMSRDPGPRIISLTRALHAAEARVRQLELEAGG